MVDCSAFLRHAIKILADNYSPLQPARVFGGGTGALDDAYAWCGDHVTPESPPVKADEQTLRGLWRDLQQLNIDFQQLNEVSLHSVHF